jgi:NTP pyrophosphatase (non-canonical NTP hydrolase)
VVVKSDAAGNNKGAEGMSLQFELDLCYCHRISIIINYVLRKQTLQVDNVKQAPIYLFYDESPFVYDTIDASKELVTYMKQTKLNKQLKNKMKQDVATRFDGLFIMLQSVSAELDESTELLKKRKQEDRTEKIFEELLDELIRLLHYFKLANKSLEPFNTPTLHLVGMWLAKLKAHLQPRDEPVTVNGANGEKMTIPADSENIAPIKVRLLKQLEEKFFLKPLHVAVAYLDPLQKNRLKAYGFTQKLIDQGLVYLKDIMRKVDPPKPPAASMSGGMRQRPPVVKKNLVKRPRTVFVHTGPS